jgi:hypothetical protein
MSISEEMKLVDQAEGPGCWKSQEKDKRAAAAVGAVGAFGIALTGAFAGSVYRGPVIGISARGL